MRPVAKARAFGTTQPIERADVLQGESFLRQRRDEDQPLGGDLRRGEAAAERLRPDRAAVLLGLATRRLDRLIARLLWTADGDEAERHRRPADPSDPRRGGAAAEIG